MSRTGPPVGTKQGNWGRRRDQLLDAMLVLFFIVKLKSSKAALIRKIQEEVNISPCSFYRTMRLGAATGEMYLFILYGLQEIQEERYDKLFTREEFPPIRSLSECPACLQKDFDAFRGERGA